MSNETRILDRARIAVIVAAAAIAATAVAQMRQAPTRPPSLPPLAAQPIPGAPPNPYLIEIGSLKQQVSALQQSVAALQTKNGQLEAKVGGLQASLLTLKQQFKDHKHELNVGWFTAKTLTSGGCPNCMVAFNVPGKAPSYTGPPKF